MSRHVSPPRAAPGATGSAQARPRRRPPALPGKQVAQPARRRLIALLVAPGRGRIAGPCLAAGVLVALSLPPFGFWIRAGLGHAVLYVRLIGLSARQRAVAGAAAGIGLLALSLLWAWEFSAPGYVAMTIAETAMLTVCIVAIPPRRGTALAFPAAIVAFEAWISAWPFGGVPLGTIALGQVGGPLGQAARLGGPLLLTALACVCGVAIGEAFRAVRGAPRHGTAALASGALAALVAAWSVAAPDGGNGIAEVRAALVQGGGQRGLSQLEVAPSVVYDAQVRASAGLRRPLDLVLWPEDVIALDQPLAGTYQDRQLGALARSLGSTVVAGVTVDVGATRFLNQAVAWGPSGSIIATYEKIHRVPFGEYVPFRGFFAHFANLSAVPRDAIPGTRPNLIRTPAGPLDVMVSYEVFFSYLGRNGVRDGGQLMIVPTNTSSYLTGQVPAQEIAASRLQAISGGRDLLQSAPTGYSAVIDNHGRVLARSSLGTRDRIVATVERRDGSTLYVRFGDVPVLALMAAGFAAAWALAGWDLAGRDLAGRELTKRGRRRSGAQGR